MIFKSGLQQATQVLAGKLGHMEQHRIVCFWDAEVLECLCWAALQDPKVGACEMAQQVEARAAKSKDLSSSPKTHVVEGENRFPNDVL